jgi:hypothetical protein
VHVVATDQDGLALDGSDAHLRGSGVAKPAGRRGV